MFFNYWIGFFNETFLFLSMCTALNFGCFQWGTFGDVFNSLLSLTIAAFLAGFAIFTGVFYIFKKNYNLIISKN